MAIGRNLNAPFNGPSAVIRELNRPTRISPADQVADAELRVCINRGPGPNVARSLRFLLWRYVLILGTYETPDFIALHPPNAHVADMRIVIVGCPFSHV